MTEKKKHVTPYQHLLEDAQKYAQGVKYAHTKLLWTYTPERVKETWSLTALRERVIAADQLGYDVILSSTVEGGITVRYRKMAPEIPYGWSV